jgi:YVTN family beta-propeller protein
VQILSFEEAFASPGIGVSRRCSTYRGGRVLTGMGRARQAPGKATDPDVPVSHHDRVYVAEQFSNTVSVIDPVNNKLLGAIRLGDPQPANLSPLYRGQVLVHGVLPRSQDCCCGLDRRSATKARGQRARALSSISSCALVGSPSFRSRWIRLYDAQGACAESA